MMAPDKTSWERKPLVKLNRAANIPFLFQINELLVPSSTSYTLFLHPACGFVVFMLAMQTYP